MEEVKAEFPIGKTQWRQWGPEARTAFNKSMRLGFEFATAVAEGNAVQAKVRAKPEEPTETVQPVKKPRAPRKKKAE
jgi:hypothetical protein